MKADCAPPTLTPPCRPGCCTLGLLEAHCTWAQRKSQTRCRAVQFTPSQGRPQSPLLPPPPCLLGIHAVHSRFQVQGWPGGWAVSEVTHPHDQPEGGQSWSSPESEAPHRKSHRLQRGRAHCAPKPPTVHLLLWSSAVLCGPSTPIHTGRLLTRPAVTGTVATHLHSTSLPRGWSAPEATAAHARSLSA